MAGAFLLGTVGSVSTGLLNFIFFFAGLTLIEVIIACALFLERKSRGVWFLAMVVYSLMAFGGLWLVYSGLYDLSSTHSKIGEIKEYSVALIGFGSLLSIASVLAMAHHYQSKTRRIFF